VLNSSVLFPPGCFIILKSLQGSASAWSLPRTERLLGQTHQSTDPQNAVMHLGFHLSGIFNHHLTTLIAESV
jgi:hypothetical protein